MVVNVLEEEPKGAWICVASRVNPCDYLSEEPEVLTEVLEGLEAKGWVVIGGGASPAVEFRLCSL